MNKENTLQEYKCPCCGGAIAFDSALQKLKCPYCDTEFDVEMLKEVDNILNSEKSDDLSWEADAGAQWQEGEAENLRIYTCNSCGGEIVGDSTTAATACPYCGNPVVMMGQLKGDLKPDLVIPFKLSKDDAKNGLTAYISKKRLLPKVFKDKNHIDEIKGIYVPFWLFDTNVNAELRYKATKTRSWSTSNFHYTETSYFLIHRGGRMSFEHIPVDGSKRMADDLMESIEPFDFSQAVDFRTAYLAGYFADRYDVTAEESKQRANARVKKTVEAEFAKTIHGYSSVTPENGSIALNGGKAKYALYPVWILNTTWNGKKYTFAMNGQTGKFVGDLPVDTAACFKWFFGLTAGIGAGVYGAMWLLGLLGIF